MIFGISIPAIKWSNGYPTSSSLPVVAPLDLPWLMGGG